MLCDMKMDQSAIESDITDSSLWNDGVVYENTKIVSENQTGRKRQDVEDSHYETLKLEARRKSKEETGIQETSLKRLKYVIYTMVVLIIVLYITLISLAIILFVPKHSVDGQWTQWSSWAECDVTCGKGTHQRTRTCTNPVSANAEVDCIGETLQTAECSKDSCPVDGRWAHWSSWTSCDVTCGTGRQLRTRRCTNPMPEYEGRNCIGEILQSGQCSKGNCSIDGQWAQWSSWTSCDVTCGKGRQLRTRRCTDPIPENKGKDCIGENLQSSQCSRGNCSNIYGPEYAISFVSAFSVQSPKNNSNINGIYKLTFSSTIYQFGNDFNISTGTYTCTKPGVYHFSVTLVKKRSSTNVDLVSCSLYKNRLDLISIRVDPTDDDTDKGNAAISQSIVINLDVGDTVYLSWCSSPSIYMESWSSFTGFLLYHYN